MLSTKYLPHYGTQCYSFTSYLTYSIAYSKNLSIILSKFCMHAWKSGYLNFLLRYPLLSYDVHWTFLILSLSFFIFVFFLHFSFLIYIKLFFLGLFLLESFHNNHFLFHVGFVSIWCFLQSILTIYE